MTSHDPTPADSHGSDELIAPFYSMLHESTELDAEIRRIEQEAAADENAIIACLVESNFSLMSHVIDIRSHTSEGSSLMDLYLSLSEKAESVPDNLSIPSDKTDSAHIEYLHICRKIELVLSIMKLAAAKGCQDTEFYEAQLADANGDVEIAEECRQDGYKIRKKAEAELLTDEMLGTELAIELLIATSHLFKGDSLVPINSDSEEYLLMYRLSIDKTEDDNRETANRSSTAKKILEMLIIPGHKDHPDFESFSFSLCWAIAQTSLLEKRAVWLTPQQVDDYWFMIRLEMKKALDLGPQIGISVADVQSMYDTVCQQIS